ncbi:MAG: hypothetical protein KDC44_09890 [Phaeodactylibacter sp.]|nr:hypothetical protein [Phaeodactylibacter sp.]
MKLFSEDVDGEWQGTVKRISDQVEATSQTVKIFIAANGNGLKEGMYLRGQISTPPIPNAIEIPRDLLVNNSELYEIIGDTLLELHEVEPVQIRENTAVVRAVHDGQLLLKNLFPNIYSGMKIKVKKAASAQKEESATTPTGGLN